MPLLIGGLLSILGVGVINLTTKTNGDSILTPQPNTGGIPSWIFPTVLLGVGAVLLYKEGAKILKL